MRLIYVKGNKKRRIAPRLWNRERRIPNYSGLPEELKAEIAKIAEKEGCSKSWVVEQIILEWAGVKIVYKEPKK